ncbi:general substrate transporter [Artomyces pyxidatus]|uniref:General substrate transporter n=1 Tax=Artomyces pyxidatus TaxID=48021 RepID=A0ACB8T8S2_9AGAM|nr:general substrate transporter [Artomyces pyxidatus]
MDTNTISSKSSIFQNSRVYWLACTAYWGIVLFGYDSGITGGVINSKYFQTEFGIIPESGTPDQRRIDTISSNIVSVLQGGAFFGALISAPMSAWMGRRYTLLMFIFMFIVGAMLTTIAGGSRGLSYIYGGRALAGFALGALSAVSPAYVSECSPKQVRGRLTGMFQIMVAIGVMLAYFVNYGIALHIHNSSKIWGLSFGFQLVPASLMALGLLTVVESPRWLASKGRKEEALANLAYLRRMPVDSDYVRSELAEIEAALGEEREARQRLGIKEAFFGRGNFIRFVIAFVIFLLQQWCGQNAINYYTPQTFTSIGYTSATGSLLASAIYGVAKVIATCIFVLFFIDSCGRKIALFVSAIGMAVTFFILAALMKTCPPRMVLNANPSAASKAMAALIYLYECFYSMGWGPLPWVYVSDIFPTGTRHYGVAVASASQWLWNFVISKITPTMNTDLGYKMYLIFASLNVSALVVFSLIVPETKGCSLEEMDIIFGTVTADQRLANIERQERAYYEDKESTLTTQTSITTQTLTMTQTETSTIVREEKCYV